MMRDIWHFTDIVIEVDVDLRQMQELRRDDGVPEVQSRGTGFHHRKKLH
jgi:hypothetical protein